MQDFSSALKFVRESLNLLLAYSLPSSDRHHRSVKPELSLQTNFTAFLILWKVHKYREALGYIKQCTHIINDLNRHSVSSFSEKTRLNLSGLISMSMAAVLVKTEGGVGRGLEIVEQCLRQLERLEVAVKPFMYRFIERLKSYREPLNESLNSSLGVLAGSLGTPNYTLPSLPSQFMEIDDLLVNRDYESLVFITVFLSHIDHTVPLIREAELEVAETRQTSVFARKHRLKGSRRMVSNRELPAVDHSSYLRLFKNIISKSKAQINAEMEPVNEDRKGRSRYFRPKRRSESERRADSISFAHRLPFPSPRISPNISILKEVQRKKASLMRARQVVDSMQTEARGRRRPKENIMVEFDQGTEGGEVSLKPVAFARAFSGEESLGRLHRRLYRDDSGFDSLIE